MVKILCEVCDNNSFENISGFYYCTVCNTQSQNVCDIQLEDEETVHVGKQINKSSSKVKKKFEPEIEKNIDSNFSTFHVLNYLLKAQVDDLIKIGVNPILKKVVLELWVSYLGKIGIAFLPHNTSISLDNIRGERDKKYFEIYQLNQEYEATNKTDSDKQFEPNDLVWPEFFKSPDTFQENVTENKIKLESTYNVDDDELEESDTEEFDPEDTIKEEEIESEGSIIKNKSRIIPLVNFQWIRMPHTICILNLALLIIKNKILVTDLIRLIFNGTVSYFNINKVLPESMEFLYATDLLMFNATLALPEAEKIRCITSKLGKFLQLKTIQLIPLNQVTSRFILDLNLPNQLHGLVNLLIRKSQSTRLKIDELDLEQGEYLNIEELALAHIYVVLIVLFRYDLPDVASADENTFIFTKWTNKMQDIFEGYKREIFGCEHQNVNTMDDLKSLKYDLVSHRHVLKTKPYISQYRRQLLKDALKAPIDNFLTKSEFHAESIESKSHLFNMRTKASISFNSATVNFYINEEKYRIIGEYQYRSKAFRKFSRDNLQFYNTKSIYQIGMEANTNEWLLEKFQHIALSGSYFKMFKCVDNLLDKII